MRVLALTILVACAGTPHPLTAQTAIGPANAPPGGVLVFSSQCADMQMHCPHEWSPTVDAIVTTGLSFHGYTTIDPRKLRKDEAHRVETTHDESGNSKTTTEEAGVEGGAVAFIPFMTAHSIHGTTVTVRDSTAKTVTIEGATLEDLTLPDRHALMDLAGATSTLTTQIVVGANWSSWSNNQRVEIMVKLSDPTGEMRWSARCFASSGEYPSPAAAIEAAAHCVADAIATPRT